MRRLISGISKMNCLMSIRSLLTCMQGNITNTPLYHVLYNYKCCIVLSCDYFLRSINIQVNCHVSIHSSDKNKCYELIKKLSAIYHSDKEYLKVCALKCVHVKMHCFV